jgi:hypothetical protein
MLGSALRARIDDEQKATTEKFSEAKQNAPPKVQGVSAPLRFLVMHKAEYKLIADHSMHDDCLYKSIVNVPISEHCNRIYRFKAHNRR